MTGSARWLPRLLVVLMAAQAALGLAMPGQYRDPEWIRAAWYGNDWLTLLAAVPLLWTGQRQACRGSVRGVLLVLGISAYAIYNYAFYLFGAMLNVFFPLYVLSFFCGTASLIVVAAQVDAARTVESFPAATPVRVIGGYLVFVAAGLSAVWLGMWAAYAFAGRATPVEPEAFKVVAALDLTLMVPALTAGGVLLWGRRPWGYFIATTAAIQGALYLLVLSVNSAIAIHRGLARAPGELPLWAPLAVCTTVAALLLLKGAQHR